MELKVFCGILNLLLCLLASNSVWPQFEPLENNIVVIDPGHGGSDPGAIGVNGVREKDITLQLAREISLLNSNKNFLKIFLTRSTDTLVSLKDRSRLAIGLNPAFFISLHLNHSFNPSAKGIEVFVADTQLSRNLSTSILVANEIQQTLTSTLGIKSRGIKFSNFQILKETVKFVPSLLLELCFISNVDEAAYISEQANLKKIAKLIYYQITQYFQQ